MTDQELADAIRERWDDAMSIDSAITGDRITDLLADNPPWEPVKGEPCWYSNGTGVKERVQFHDSSGSWDDGEVRVNVWYENHRYSKVHSVRLSRLSPRGVGK